MSMIKEGEKGVNIHNINPSENRDLGSSIGYALSDIPNKAKIKF